MPGAALPSNEHTAHDDEASFSWQTGRRRHGGRGKNGNSIRKRSQMTAISISKYEEKNEQMLQKNRSTVYE